jgi:DNA-binding transcriptional MocR family regulator
MMIPIEIEKMELDVYARAVYQRIQYRAGGHSSHFESQENMAKSLFISTRQIMRKMKELEEKKMIHIEKRGRNKDGHFMTNLVTLLDPSEWDFPHRVTVSHTAMRTTVTPPCDSQSHITRSQEELDLNLTINAAGAQQTAPKQVRNTSSIPSDRRSLPPDKRTRPPSKRKMKLWDEKSEDEKIETLWNQANDAQRLGTDRGAIRYFPFKDIPDLLLPIIKTHGLETVKKFFDYLQKETIGCDIRSLDWALENFKKWQKSQNL